MDQLHYPFALQPLPYDYQALSAAIDPETVRIHHDLHLKTYVDKLNAALAPLPQFHNTPLCQLLTQNDQLPENVRLEVWNNGGGVYNHNLYFSLLTPHPSPLPQPLADAFTQTFGSFEAFKAAMKEAALSQFGSGYAWLVSDKSSLSILKTANQDTPLSTGQTPLLLIDVWEHAYYLRYQNRRAEYLDTLWQVINWAAVGQRYDQARMG